MLVESCATAPAKSERRRSVVWGKGPPHATTARASGSSGESQGLNRGTASSVPGVGHETEKHRKLDPATRDVNEAAPRRRGKFEATFLGSVPMAATSHRRGKQKRTAEQA